MASFISADSVVLVINGDFSEGSRNWTTVGDVSFADGKVLISENDIIPSLSQYIDTSRKDLKLSFDVYSVTYGSAEFYVGVLIYNGGADAELLVIDIAAFHCVNAQGGGSFYISDCYAYYNSGADLPDFDRIQVSCKCCKLYNLL